MNKSAARRVQVGDKSRMTDASESRMLLGHAEVVVLEATLARVERLLARHGPPDLNGRGQGREQLVGLVRRVGRAEEGKWSAWVRSVGRHSACSLMCGE
jgi:hypothetical protein